MTPDHDEACISLGLYHSLHGANATAYFDKPPFDALHVIFCSQMGHGPCWPQQSTLHLDNHTKGYESLLQQQQQQQQQQGLENQSELLGFTRPTCRCASIDGDADRLLYFVPHSHRGIQLLDGDRIAVLAATLINRILQGRPAALPDPTQQDQLAGSGSIQVKLLIMFP